MLFETSKNSQTVKITNVKVPLPNGTLFGKPKELSRDSK